MVIACWSVKGGSGTTVVAASLGLLLARQGPGEVVLVDLAGDLPAVLGLPEPAGPGVADWLSAGAEVAADGWARLTRPVTTGLVLVGRGEPSMDQAPVAARAQVLAGMLAAEHRHVVIDCGVVGSAPGGPGNVVGQVLAGGATHSLLVTRPCYLALRRLPGAPLHPSGIVVVREAGRALDAADVAAVAGAPVVAEVAVEAEIARAVDAGLLARRLPRGLDRALRRVA